MKKKRTDAWASTPDDLRNRPAIRVTLSREAIAALDALAARWGIPRSRAVERLVYNETSPHPSGTTTGPE